VNKELFSGAKIGMEGVNIQGLAKNLENITFKLDNSEKYSNEIGYFR
jgi:hypothetical protein